MQKILIVDDDPLVVELLVALLRKEDFQITTRTNGKDALELMGKEQFALLMCDVWMPGLSGLELIAEMHKLEHHPAVIIMTADDTPETMLRAIREQAHQFVSKPFKPAEMRRLVNAIMSDPSLPPIEVVSAKPEWVELLVPCELRSVDRLQGLVMKLKADLPQEIRESMTQAFRELLLNAIEWGGKLDVNSKVRISFIRGKRMLIYRIADPGEGFEFNGLQHAAVNNPNHDPIEHFKVREEKGLRPGGLGILMTQSLVDELVYNEAQNEVVCIKYLD